MMSALITVEIAYADPENQFVLDFQIPMGSNIKQAILAPVCLSKLKKIGLISQESLDFNAEILLALNDRIGIFGRQVSLDYILQEGDRIEIYRPLLQDPKISRRIRAKRYPLKKKATPTK